jgi:uncharacterized protein
MSTPPDDDLQKTRTGAFILTVLRRRALLIGALIVGVVALSVGAGKPAIDNSLSIWFLEDDPALLAWDEFKEQFGNDEAVIIAATDPETVYSPAALARIRAASDRIEQHGKVRRVTSITTGRAIDGDAFEIRTEPLLADGPVTDEEAAAVRARIAANPIYQGTITSSNEQMTLLVVELATMDDIDAQRPEILRDLRAIADEELTTGGGTVHYGGMGVVYEGLNEASLRDSQLFATLSYLVVFVGLFIMFRRLIWVFIGMAVITIAVVATVGIAVLAGRDLNMVLAVLPTLIMTVGILDLIHFVESYDEHRGAGGTPSRGRFVAAAGVVLLPCAFNTLTDAVGFLSLSSARMSAIRDLGWLAAVGLAVLFVTMVVIVIPALHRFGGGRPRVAPERGVLSTAARTLHAIAATRRHAVLVGAVLIGAVSILGIMKLKVDTYTIGFLAGDDPVRQDHDHIAGDFGYFVPYEFVIRTPEVDGIKDPELLRRIERLERAFEAHEAVGRTTGLPEIISRVNQVVFDGEPDEYRIPDTREAVAQELMLYESDSRNELDQMVSGDFTVARVTARAGLPTARTIGKTLEELLAIGQAELGELATIEASGYIPLYVRIIDHVARAQITSFGIALVVITLVLMLLFRSIRMGLIALVPNVLPVLMVLGTMGLVGIRLDVATVLIASIIIGLAVNDSTHLLFRFRHEMGKTGGDRAEAVRRTMQGAGRAVVGSSLILAAGFAVLIFAGVKSVAYFGLLCSLATIFVLIADLLILPALLLTFRNET